MMVFPLLLIFLWMRGGKLIFEAKTMALGLVGGLLPLSLYAYLPLRWAQGPAFNYVGQYFDVALDTPTGLLWMISGRMFSHRMFDLPLSLMLQNFGLQVQLITFSLLGLGLVLIVLSVLNTSHRLLLLFVGGALSMLIFFSGYNVIDASTMLLPSFVWLMPLYAKGLQAVSDLMQETLGPGDRPQAAIHACAAGLIAVLLVVNWPLVDRSRDINTYAYAHTVTSQVEANALIIAQWETAAPLNYLLIVEGRRPDITILDRGGHALGIYDQHRRLYGVDSDAELAEIARNRLLSLIEAEVKLRPVFITDNDWLLDHLVYERQEHVYRVVDVNRDRISEAER
ncbi:MAG: hypothetical protein GYB68_18645 [Chloroflexi bacterium]|nr:hypothetical protein [Chloroflexota bacterium]